MKKLFFAICFIAAGANLSPVFAASRELRDQIELQQKQQQTPSVRPLSVAEDANIPQDPDELREYIAERSKIVPTMTMEQINQTSTMSTQWSSDYIASQNPTKSTFEQIYDQAMDRLSSADPKQPQDIMYYVPQDAAGRQRQEWQRQQQKLDFPVINITLPNGENALAPAKEHIPYLLSRIEILPNGMIHIKETVNVIANGEKLKHGLSKALPKYSTSRTGVRNRTIPYLNGVKVNGVAIDYKIKDAYDRYLITPKFQYDLQPGIYTFEFDYMLDRKLWYYDQFNEFYWDATGSFWNLVVARAVATVRLPVNVSPLAQTMLLGYPPNNLSNKDIKITQDQSTNVLGFAATVPLFAGEGMHMIISIPKSGFIDPDFNKKFEWFVEDYGDIIFSLAALIAIWLAFQISWKYIVTNANKEKALGARSPALMRRLLRGLFDKNSFGAFLLELYAKNIIDIREENGAVYLIKRTDKLKSLDKNERKIMATLFGAKETALKINDLNRLRLQRAYRLLEKNVKRRMHILLAKLVSGYIALSCAMLLLGQAAIAFSGLNSGEIFAALISFDLSAAFYIWVLQKNFANHRVGVSAKTGALVMIVLLLVGIGFFVHIATGILIVATIVTIFSYGKKFVRRDGLIKNNIAEVQKYVHYLEDNAQKIILGREFKKLQPFIFALDTIKEYPSDLEDYKIDLIQKALLIL